MNRFTIGLAVFPLLAAVGCSESGKDDILATEISLDVKKLELSAGSQALLTVTVEPDSYNGTFDWTSSHPDIVSVDGTGKVTALSEGDALISVVASGKKAVCNVTVFENEVKIGNYYYSDGSVTDKVLDTKDVIGVVFWTGNPAESDAALKKDHPDCTHGLVVSLDQKMTCWQSRYGKDPSATVGAWVSANRPELVSPLTGGCGMEDSLNKILGYNNTVAIEAFNSSKENADMKVDAVEVVKDFRNAVVAPESSSGWYLPSAKELTLLCIGEYDGNIYDTEGTILVERKNLINKSLDRLKDARSLSPSVYWSSTEGSFEGAFNVYFDDGDTSASFKDFKSAVVRCILAF